MAGVLQLIRLNQTKVQVEIMMVTVHVVAVIEVEILVVHVDLTVEIALNVGNLDILLGNVPVKVVEEVGMVVGMTNIVVVVAAVVDMVRTEMEIDLVGAIGVVVTEEVREVIDIAVTALGRMNDAVLVVFVLDRIMTYLVGCVTQLNFTGSLWLPCTDDLYCLPIKCSLHGGILLLCPAEC